ncbi:MAG: hypothetical protein M3Y42_00290 [Actinomycetota bacterium]|nr:hypothetical protein [Actinomycetota bacterium]MDQ2955393.1 hypothetical protein [Actinomycetota bacterium]
MQDSTGRVRRFRCERCGDEVIVLPRASDRVLVEFYARSFPTEELPAGDR